MILLALFTLAAEGSLPGTAALQPHPDFSAAMVDGIARFLDAETAGAPARRDRLPLRSPAERRAALRNVLGMHDAPAAPALLDVGGLDEPAELARNPRFSVRRVKWPAFGAVHGEGLLFEPKDAAVQLVIVPDAAETPEAIAIAPRLAERGVRTIVMAVVDRKTALSGNPALGRRTTQPHREWVYRSAFTMGRSLLGYETQRLLGAVNALQQGARKKLRTFVFGRGADGGRVALLAAALDERIVGAMLVNGFGPREGLWREPIDRNLFGVLEQFGDAEVAALLGPRPLMLLREPGATPMWSAARAATPGGDLLPKPDAFRAEVARARKLGASGLGIVSPESMEEVLVRMLLPAPEERFPGVPAPNVVAAVPQDFRMPPASDAFLAARQARTVNELVEHTQALLRASHRVRDAKFAGAKPAKNLDWHARTAALRKEFDDVTMGRFDRPFLPPRPRTRRHHETAKWVCHEVVLDVYPEVFAWGWLLLPKDLKPGERRPVVVCQHGLEGLPEDTVTTDPKHRGFGPYQGFAAKLADEGFVVFAPHNPYRGQDAFRSLQRRANPLGKSLFTFIIAQHRVLTAWLAAQPFVDPARIGFYGLSYGGKTAMRVPAVVERYCLSICSADFNEWVEKNASVDWPFSYVFTGEHEIFEWNLGHTFNYAEMAALIAPRPFMVERGHDDGVGLDERVAHEYAKVRRLYAKLGFPSRTEIEFFDGPHMIHGAGTFDFLRRQLRWPPR